MRISSLALLVTFLSMPACGDSGDDDGSTSDDTAAGDESTEGGTEEDTGGTMCTEGCPTLDAMPPGTETVSIEWVDLDTETASIKNSATDFVTTTDWQICAGPGRYAAFDSNTIPQSASVVIDISGLNLQDTDALGIYSGSDFTAAADMRAFVQWGAAGSARETVAVDAGLWTAGTFVTLCEGDTLLVATGDTSMADAWDSTDASCAP